MRSVNNTKNKLNNKISIDKHATIPTLLAKTNDIINLFLLVFFCGL